MEEHLDLFPTPVSLYRFEDADAVNGPLRDYALRRAAQEPGIRRSNVGSWHSEVDLPADPDPAVQRLHAFMLRCFDTTHARVAAEFGPPGPRPRWLAQGWLMVMGDGHFTDVHSHSDALWSGVYYVDAGDPRSPQQGQLALVDPRVGVERSWPSTLFPSTFGLAPESGVMVVFPSWLKHYVYPYSGTRPRVSVSYNVTAAPPAT